MDQDTQNKIDMLTEIAERRTDKVADAGKDKDGYELLIRNVDGRWGLFRRNTYGKDRIDEDKPKWWFDSAREAVTFGVVNKNKSDIETQAIINLVRMADILDSMGLHKRADVVDGMIMRIGAMR